MVINKSSKIVNFNVDLVILGAGGAGLTAAVTAAEQSIKRILVLEKERIIGGNSRRAAGIFVGLAVNSGCIAAENAVEYILSY
jgi:glycine/D-amino acid oxidase-like deaminating enzyme